MSLKVTTQHHRLNAAAGFSVERAIKRCWFGVNRSRALSLPEQIAVTLSVRILSLELAPGERVIEQDLAEQFEVSRGPIRESLRILEREELVLITARRGCIVTRLSSEEVSDIFEVRAALLGMVARKHAAQRSPAALKILDSLIASLDEVVEVEDDQGLYAEAVFENGLQLVEATGSLTLARMLAPLALRTLRYSLFGLRSVDRRRQSLKLWRAERQAIDRGDVNAAGEASVARILNSRDEALRSLAQLEESRL